MTWFKKIIQNYFIIFLKLLGEKKLKPVKLMPSNVKSLNTIEKYPHIIDSQGFILNMLYFHYL